MNSNFDFLKNKEEKLFNIISDAEKLYRDGYFEQTIAQTRKYAEIIAKKTLGVRRTSEETFDEILSTLKDIIGNSPSDKEFIDDLFFLKKRGNLAVHEAAANHSGNDALECLQRAFEIGINFAIKSGWGNKRILNLHYSIDLLMTGQKSRLSEKYQKIKEEKVIDLNEYAKKRPKKAIQKKTKKDKTEEKENLIPYVATGGILIIFLISIFIFILPA